MELAQSLLRSCVRSFYETKHVLVIDALIIHSALRDDDLAYLMGMNTKELHKLCGRLKEARFLAVHTRAETKENQQRPMNRTYYYIDYRASIDAIKWRVYLMNKKVQGNTVPEQERKEYFCPRCKSEFTQIEVLDKWDIQKGFLCGRCNAVLTHDPDNNRGGHEQSTKYHSQFTFITDLLPKLDEVIVPENTFERALASQLKVIRADTNPANETAPVDPSMAKPTAVRGLANVGPTSISVTLTAGEGPTEADIAADLAKKEKLMAQNAMPVHFTHSTITGDEVIKQRALFPSRSAEDDKKKPEFDEPDVGEAAEIDSFFANLKAQQLEEAAKEKDEEYETDEEDDEDEFEDVIAAGSGSGTPVSSQGDSSKRNAAAISALPSALKKGGSASASGTSTGANSPITGPGTPNDDGRPSKKVKIEEPAVKAEDDESEEDMEFEDV